tara:strand:+ start:56 stop:628 length:573 start_codon:yes stop_codon:yes gene_type:complete
MTSRRPLIINPSAQQIQELPNGDDLNVDGNITSTGEITADGKITAVQPTCLLTNPVTYTAQFSNNNTPIDFQTVTTNVGCTVNANKDKITVPTAGTYLVSAMVSGVRNTATEPTDSMKFMLLKGGSAFPSVESFPRGVFGTQNAQEFFINFTMPLTLAANDELELVIVEVNENGSTAEINKGYFSVTRLH